MIYRARAISSYMNHNNIIVVDTHASKYTYIHVWARYRDKSERRKKSVYRVARACIYIYSRQIRPSIFLIVTYLSLSRFCPPSKDRCKWRHKQKGKQAYYYTPRAREMASISARRNLVLPFLSASALSRNVNKGAQRGRENEEGNSARARAPL